MDDHQIPVTLPENFKKMGNISTNNKRRINMQKEIEKKYLLSALPQGLYRGTPISQGYITVGDPEVRVRDKGGVCFLTRKGGEGFIRDEEDRVIIREIFHVLWTTTEGKRLEKIRYTLIDGDFTWEIDQYLGILTGLFTAEVELPNADVIAILPPSIAEVTLADVTLDKRFKNKALATADHIPIL
jgi:CYTH domain-containing protein